VREDRQQLLMDASGEEATGWMRKINMAVRRRADCAAPVAAASAADPTHQRCTYGTALTRDRIFRRPVVTIFVRRRSSIQSQSSVWFPWFSRRSALIMVRSLQDAGSVRHRAFLSLDILLI